MGSTLVWHLSNFAFNSAAAHLLGPADYGTLAAVVAMFYVASPFLVSIQTIASRLTTKLGARGEWARVRWLVRYYALRMVLVGVLLTTSVAIGSTALARFLRIPSATPIAILGCLFVVSVVTHLQRGVLQGSMRFGRYAVSTLTEASAKFGLAVVLLAWVWRSVNAAVLAITVASLFALIVNSALLSFLPKVKADLEPVTHPYRFSLVTLCCLLLLALLLSVDLLAAKRYLHPHAAGLYAAASLSGKVTFFATSALSLYLFPIFSHRHESGIDSKGTLRRALTLVVAGSGLLSTIYFLVPQLIITPLFGSRYEDAGSYIGWMSLAFGAYAVVYLTAMYLLSHENTSVNPVLAVAALAQICGLYIFHSTISSIIAVEFVVLGSTAVVLSSLCAQPQVVPAGAPEPT